jgi:hypothetical protein
MIDDLLSSARRNAFVGAVECFLDEFSGELTAIWWESIDLYQVSPDTIIWLKIAVFAYVSPWYFEPSQ